MLRVVSLISWGLTKAIHHRQALHSASATRGCFPLVGSPSENVCVCWVLSVWFLSYVRVWCVHRDTGRTCLYDMRVQMVYIWSVCPHQSLWHVGVCVCVLRDHFSDSEFASATLRCLVLCLVLFPFPCVILWVIRGHLSPLVRPQGPSRPPGSGLAGPSVQPAVATRRLTALTHAWREWS